MATPRLRSAVRFFLDAEDEDHLAEALVVCATEALALGRPERSARLLGAADGLWSSISLPLSPADAVPVDRCRAAVKSAMGTEAYARASEQGRAMTADQAVAFALEANLWPLGTLERTVSPSGRKDAGSRVTRVAQSRKANGP